MSAWIVEKGHVDCLVQAMVVEEMVPMAEATDTGQMMWEENHRSVNERYRETTPTPEYTFRGIEAPLEDAVVYVQLKCFDYQSCEHDGWEESEAKRLCDELSARLVIRNGGDEDFDAKWKARNYSPDHPGCNTYGSIKWGITSIDEAMKIGA